MSKSRLCRVAMEVLLGIEPIFAYPQHVLPIRLKLAVCPLAVTEPIPPKKDWILYNNGKSIECKWILNLAAILQFFCLNTSIIKQDSATAKPCYKVRI